ncbi:hypothetical protein HDV05_001577 [Chytridiales sp. JEL 0842]|nr:hypothetical protein HDV05_001577 [Chytridiales sp. JEL 0842]
MKINTRLIILAQLLTIVPSNVFAQTPPSPPPGPGIPVVEDGPVNPPPRQPPAVEDDVPPPPPPPVEVPPVEPPVFTPCGPILSAFQAPANFNITHTFYKKYLPGPAGIPILGSNKVLDEALYRAQKLLFQLAETMDAAIFEKLANGHWKAGIMASTEVTRDVPEHAYLESWYDKENRGLALGKVITGGEENLLCDDKDIFHGQCHFLRQVARGILDYGVSTDFEQRVVSTHAKSVASGKWVGTTAEGARGTWWEVGSQLYFNCNDDYLRDLLEVTAGRDELETYDPELFDLLSSIYKNAPYAYSCNITPICHVPETIPVPVTPPRTTTPAIVPPRTTTHGAVPPSSPTTVLSVPPVPGTTIVVSNTATTTTAIVDTIPKAGIVISNGLRINGGGPNIIAITLFVTFVLPLLSFIMF